MNNNVSDCLVIAQRPDGGKIFDWNTLYICCALLLPCRLSEQLRAQDISGLHVRGYVYRPFFFLSFLSKSHVKWPKINLERRKIYSQSID